MPMVRSTRRRGVQRGVAKHRIASNFESEQDSDPMLSKLASKLLKIFFFSPKCFRYSPSEATKEKPIQALAKLCYRLSSRLVFNLCLLQIRILDDGRCIKVSKLRGIIHHFVVAALVISIIVKVFICVNYAVTTQLMDIRLMVSILGISLELAAFCGSISAILMPEATKTIINSWPVMSAHVKDALKLSHAIDPFDDMMVSIKVAGLLVAGVVAATQFPIANFLIEDVPIFLQPNLERLEVFQGAVQSKLVRRMVCYPLEVLWYAIPVGMLLFSGPFIVLEIGFFKLYLRQLSKLSDHRLWALKVLEHLYVVIQIHNQHIYRWMQVCLFPLLMTVGGGVVLYLYIPIKHQEIPAILSASFLTVGLVVQGVIFWTSYDVVVAIRASEGVIGRLQSRSSRNKQLDSFKDISKRCKAHRQVNIPIGSFGAFSIEVPIIMWDEILNQLLFLLGF